MSTSDTVHQAATSAGGGLTLNPSQKHYVRAAVVGIAVGFLAMAFRWAIEFAEQGRGAVLAWAHARPHAELWGWAVLPAIGIALGCFSGWLVMRLSPQASGSGIPSVKGALMHLTKLRGRTLVPVKFIGGVLCVGAGLSLGREGPTVQMGASVAQAIGKKLGVRSRTLPQIMSCGAGAGVAAAFNAPLAGFLFVIEELHREMSALTFGGALIAAVSADIVARLLKGQLPSFSVQGYPALPLSALPAAAVLGAICGVFGVLFTRGVLWSSAAAHRIRVLPRWMMPGLVAAVCGLVAWWMPDAAGGGHAVAERLLGGGAAPAVGALLLLLGLKFVLTMLSYASGAPGGVLAPMLLMGAILGILASRVAGIVQPSLGHSLDAFAVLGMAALFTGSIRAPLTGIVLILEMTANYEQLLSVSVACLVSYLVADHLRTLPMYEAMLEADLRRRGGPETHGESDEPRSVVMGVQRDSALHGRSIRDAGLPRGCLVVAVERGGRELLPQPELVLAPGDHITVLTPAARPDLAMRVVDLARAR